MWIPAWFKALYIAAGKGMNTRRKSLGSDALMHRLSYLYLCTSAFRGQAVTF